jgi:predicted DNA-binding transcriptional regulator AlpA
MARYEALPPGVLPFAVSREAAAALIGISPSKFDMLVSDGRMPQPRELDSRVLWDVEEVRAAWRALPRRGELAQDVGSAWDKALAR